MHGLNDIWGPDGPMRELRPLLLWVATALVALAIGDAAFFVPLAAALIATLIVVTASGPSTTARIVFAVAFIPTAFPAHAPTAVWALAAPPVSAGARLWVVRPALVCGAPLLAPRGESGEAGPLRPLGRPRRRGEPVSVM